MPLLWDLITEETQKKLKKLLPEGWKPPQEEERIIQKKPPKRFYRKK